MHFSGLTSILQSPILCCGSLKSVVPSSCLPGSS